MVGSVFVIISRLSILMFTDTDIEVIVSQSIFFFALYNFRYDMLAAAWIISYLLENVRTIHRLYRYSGHGRTGPDGSEAGKNRIFKRWLTFRNIYILATDLVFLISLVLRCLAHYNK